MIRQVYRVGFTVSDLDPVLAFYTQVLPFEIIDDCVAPRFIEGVGEPYEKLTGVFGARVRVVTLGLGQEQIQLTQFIAPRQLVKASPYLKEVEANLGSL